MCDLVANHQLAQIDADSSYSLFGYRYSSEDSSTIFFLLFFYLFDPRYPEDIDVFIFYAFLLFAVYFSVLFSLSSLPIAFFYFCSLFFGLPFAFLLNFSSTFLSSSSDSEFSSVSRALLSSSIFFLSFFSAICIFFEFLFGITSFTFYFTFETLIFSFVVLD